MKPEDHRSIVALLRTIQRNFLEKRLTLLEAAPYIAVIDKYEKQGSYQFTHKEIELYNQLLDQVKLA